MASTTPVASPERSWLRPATPLERGQLAVLLSLVVLTLGTWALTVHQARTVGMPMGVVARGAAEDDAASSDGMGAMAASGMAGMAAGVMSLAWMALLTLVVFAEKVLPVGPMAAKATGTAFLVLGVLIAAGATDLPWMV